VQTGSDLAAGLALGFAGAGGAPPLVMLSGAQGSGKSFTARSLAASPILRVATLSLDDVYLTRAQRGELARTRHPLLSTRGPPGTHDISLLRYTLDCLRDARDDSETPLPRFDKAGDDRTPEASWPRFRGRPDLILLEGWLAGALPDRQAPGSAPINSLEEEHDGDGRWRAIQETALAGPYASLWDEADAFIHLIAPDFETVNQWRTEQQAETEGVPLRELSKRSHDFVRSFTAFFERITLRMMAGARRDGCAVWLRPDRSVIRFERGLT